jgi:hypothetical protein
MFTVHPIYGPTVEGSIAVESTLVPPVDGDNRLGLLLGLGIGLGLGLGLQ